MFLDSGKHFKNLENIFKGPENVFVGLENVFGLEKHFITSKCVYSYKKMLLCHHIVALHYLISSYYSLII